MKKMIRFIFPIWVSMIISSLLGIVDYSFLKSISIDYLTIIGIAYIPYILIDCLLVGIGIESNRSTANNTNANFVDFLLFSLISSVILVAFSIYMSDYLLFFAKENPFYSDIKSYFNILIYLLIPGSIFYLCTGILRGKGIPKNSIYFNVLSLILNFIFDYVFIKLNFWDNPLKGCAIASVLADSISATAYLIFILKNKYADLSKSRSTKFVSNVITYSIEKVFSSSTLQLISTIYVSKLSIAATTIYFSIETYFVPILLLTHCHFEWVIFSTSKNIQYRSKKTYWCYFLLTFIYANIITLYLGIGLNGFLYSLLYVVYCILFLIERTTVANFFAEEKGKSVNKVIFFKSLILILLLQIFFISNIFNLYSFMFLNLITMIGEILVLKFIKKSQIYALVNEKL